MQSTQWKSFHPDCVVALNKILDNTNAMIVLSSCWRHGFIDWPNKILIDRKDALRVMQRWFDDCGLPSQRLIDKTPDFVQLTVDGEFASGHRGTEISMWLDKHSRVQSFILLDDDSDMEPHKDRLVQTHEPEGLTLENADQAISLLTDNTSFGKVSV